MLGESYNIIYRLDRLLFIDRNDGVSYVLYIMMVIGDDWNTLTEKQVCIC